MFPSEKLSMKAFQNVSVSSFPFHVIPRFYRKNCRLSFSSRVNIEKTERMDPLAEAKSRVIEIFKSAVRAVQPTGIIENSVKIVDNELRFRDKTFEINENVYLVGFGKAVMGMAAAMEKKLGDRLRKGIVSIPRGSKEMNAGQITADDEQTFLPNFNGRIEYLESSKDNQPDAETLITSRKIIDLAENLQEKDTLIVLISGGGSALFYMPRPPLTSEAKLKFCKRLQNSGAAIKELNVVRKKLSTVKGGGLALMAHPAKVITLIISDIVGDPIDLVASGPTCYSEKSPEEVAAILRKYNLEKEVEGDLKTLLLQKEAKIDEKSLLNAKKEFKHVDNLIIGNNSLATEAACHEARKKGFTPVVVSNEIAGNVKLVSESYAKLAALICRCFSKELKIDEFHALTKNDEILPLSTAIVNEIFEISEQNSSPQILLIAGGEPEVVVRGGGKGGRNQELALNFSLDFYRLAGQYRRLTDFEVLFLSAGTDGQDGPTDAAGAFGYPAIEPKIAAVLKKLQDMSRKLILSNNEGPLKNSELSEMLREAEKIVPRVSLENNDSYNFYSRFRRGKDLLKTGITGTNVMDLHFLLIRKRDCACSIDFPKGAICPDPLEEHDLCEEATEKARRLAGRKEIESDDRKLLNLRILDPSLGGERCCN